MVFCLENLFLHQEIILILFIRKPPNQLGIMVWESRSGRHGLKPSHLLDLATQEAEVERLLLSWRLTWTNITRHAPLISNNKT